MLRARSCSSGTSKEPTTPRHFLHAMARELQERSRQVPPPRPSGGGLTGARESTLLLTRPGLAKPRHVVEAGRVILEGESALDLGGANGERLSRFDPRHLRVDDALRGVAEFDVVPHLRKALPAVLECVVHGGETPNEQNS
jgi:hypothetical protein